MARKDQSLCRMCQVGMRMDLGDRSSSGLPVSDDDVDSVLCKRQRVVVQHSSCGGELETDAGEGPGDHDFNMLMTLVRQLDGPCQRVDRLVRSIDADNNVFGLLGLIGRGGVHHHCSIGTRQAD